MPFYEYRCEGCGHDFDRLVRSMTAKVKVTCPSCGGNKAVQRLSVFSARTAPASSPARGAQCGTCTDGSCPYAGG